MAIIARQEQIFNWTELEVLGDLKRLLLVLDNLPDEKLMRVLEKERFRGRDDYPVRAMWNATLAGVIYQHPSAASLLRELSRNSQLRRLCGFLEEQIPTQSAFSRFLSKLFLHQPLIDELFETLVKTCYELLPSFGKHLALDGKALRSLSRRASKKCTKDGRRDTDADFGAKSYRRQGEGGSLWQKTVYWFGYRLHLLVDADYELPVAYSLTKASRSEIKVAHQLLDDLGQRRPHVLESCQYLSADRGYDDTRFLTRLFDDCAIRPLIDITNQWPDKEETRLLDGHTNLVYDYRGTIYCCCPQELKLRQMAYAGLEKKRGALKYRCPATHYGIKCQGKKDCPLKSSVRIYMAEDRRRFCPLPRSSYLWQGLYSKRTAVERVNSRLDVSFGFEQHFIRGQKKMQFRCSIALCIMLAMAIGHVKEQRPELLRSLVRTA